MALACLWRGCQARRIRRRLRSKASVAVGSGSRERDVPCGWQKAAAGRSPAHRPVPGR